MVAEFSIVADNSRTVGKGERIRVLRGCWNR
jgi:hypothetical protein